MTIAEDSIVISVIAPGESAPAAGSGRERRASERVIAYWRDRIAELGADATIAALDVAAFNSAEWSYRFIMTIDPLLDGSSLLLYGSDVARLLRLPEGSKARVPIMRRLPPHYVPVFRRGCSAVLEHNAGVRVEGKVSDEDGREELFRAIIIPLRGRADNTVRLAFGAFSSSAR
jgi:hypothetical protein